MRRSNLVPAAVLAAVLVVPGLAAAYLPSGPGVLRRAGERIDELKLQTMELRGAAQLRGETAKAAAAALGVPASDQLFGSVVLAYRAPGRCRLELTAPAATKKASAVFKNGALSGTGLESAPAVRAWLSAACELLSARTEGENESRGQLAKALKARGVDTSAVSLKKLGATVAFALGTAGQDKPQAWFDKEQFLPLRVLATEGGVLWDLRLLERGKPGVGVLHPRVVEVGRGFDGAPELRLVLESADLAAPAEGL